MKLDGTWTAIVTPMNADFSVNWEGLEKCVEFQISQGITGVVPVGTTGESPTLTWEEHTQVVDRVLAQCKGKCGVLAGAGSNSTSEAIVSAGHAVSSGAEAVLVVDCYYNGPSSRELRDEYYAVLAREFPNTSIVPYIIPGRSGTALACEDLALLAAQYPNIATVKEATGDLERMAKTRSLIGDGFSIMSGDDDLTFKMMSDTRIRANGVISVVSNVAPAALQKMVKLASSGDLEGAGKMSEALAPLLGIVTVKVNNERVLHSGDKVTVSDKYRNPVAIKTLMSGLGLPSGPGRRPLGKMSSAGVKVVRDAVKQVWDNNPEVLQPASDFFGINIAARLADDSVWEALAL
ncbi:MAG: 4-hydroxy-tetrahydrodipicolinate synthase [Armatimonadota bacterium]|nr:4-hydroxy-tetrahydrodipicolinate synthase [bacterium]